MTEIVRYLFLFILAVIALVILYNVGMAVVGEL